MNVLVAPIEIIRKNALTYLRELFGEQFSTPVGTIFPPENYPVFPKTKTPVV